MILLGLQQLLVRSKFRTTKYASGANSALEKLDKEQEQHINASIEECTHTMEEAHGPKTDINSLKIPHMSQLKNFVLVHNGIIENYLEIKKKIKKKHDIFCVSRN